MQKDIKVLHRDNREEDYRGTGTRTLLTSDDAKVPLLWESSRWKELNWKLLCLEGQIPAMSCLYQICWIATRPPVGHIIVADTYPASYLLKRKLDADEVLYLGKTKNLSKRIAGQFSRKHGSNGLARKLRALICATPSSSKISQQISDVELEEVKKLVKIKYAEVEDWLERDFLKSYGKCLLKPLLNIEAER